MAKKKSNKNIKENIPFFTKPFKEKGKGKKSLRKKSSIFKKIDQKEEDIIAGAFKNKLSKPKAKSKPEKEKVIVAPSKPKSKNKNLYLIIILVAILLLIVFFFLIYLLYPYLERPRDRNLEAGENVETAVVRADSTLDVHLKDFNPDTLLSVKFILLGNAEYYYETSGIKQDYTFYPSDFGINNFDSVVKASAVFTYKTEPVPPGGGTTPPTQTKPNCTDGKKNGGETGVDCGGSCKACSPPGGGGGSPGGGSETPCTPKTCADYAGKCGSFSNGCPGGTLTCTCSEGFYCYTGAGASSSVCVNNSFSCVDSDGGKDYYTKGNVTVNNSNTIISKEDTCFGSLTEFFCYYNGSVFEARNESYKCPYRCKLTGGACERLLCEADANCTTLNLPKIESCTNIPDSNPFTWDYRNEFISTCVSKECTYGDESVSSKCINTKCGAECNDGDTQESANTYCLNNDLYRFVYECNSTCRLSNLSTANDILSDNCVRTCNPSGCNFTTRKYVTYNASSDLCPNNRCVEPANCTTPISSVCDKDCGAECENDDNCIGEKVCDSNCNCQGFECTSHVSCGAGKYCDSSGVCQPRLNEGTDCGGVEHPVWPGQSTDYVCSGQCKADYDGDGKYCVALASSCTHNAVTYLDGSRAPDCLSSTNERKCMIGIWTSGTTCEDADKCNGISECEDGACQPGTSLICNDNNACNGLETCSPASGCVDGIAPNCNDLVGCTEDSCHPLSGCMNLLNDSKCEVWESCTSPGGCVQSSCSGCTDCNVWNKTAEPCDYNKCHNKCNKIGSCYFSGNVLGPCVSLTTACSSITACADYSQAECENDPCGKSDTGCIWDADTCIVKPVCGNNVLERTEVCDNSQLGGKTCGSFFDHASPIPGAETLRCCSSTSPPNCSSFDFSSCKNKTYTSCSDSDGGLDYYTYGRLSSLQYTFNYGADCSGAIRYGGVGSEIGGYNDYCVGENTLREYYCDADKSPHYVDYSCGAGHNLCNNRRGVCVGGYLPSLSIWESIKQFFSNLFQMILGLF